MSPPTNQHPTFYRPDALPVARKQYQRTEGKCHWKLVIHHLLMKSITSNLLLCVSTGTYPCGDLGFAPVAAFSLHDRLTIAASAAEQSQVAVTAVDDGEVVATLKPHDAAGMVMDIKEAGEGLIAAGYEDGSVVVWDIRFPDCVKNVARLHLEPVSSFDYCGRTQRGVSASVDGTVISWSGTELRQTAAADVRGGVACVRARTDGKLFAVGACDSRIHIFSGRPKLLPLAVVRAHTQSVQSLAFNKCHQLAAGSRDKTVSIWSMYKDS